MFVGHVCRFELSKYFNGWIPFSISSTIFAYNLLIKIYSQTLEIINNSVSEEEILINLIRRKILNTNIK